MGRRAEACTGKDKIMEGIKAIYDNHGRTYDRYTVFYSESGWNSLYHYVAMSGNPNHPQGFCQHGEGIPGPHCGTEITFDSLPIACQEIVKKELSGE